MGSSDRANDDLAVLAHDLRAPLAIISAYAQRLEEPGLSGDERRALLATIHRNVERMAGLIDGIAGTGKAP